MGSGRNMNIFLIPSSELEGSNLSQGLDTEKLTDCLRNKDGEELGALRVLAGGIFLN